jgi:YHS domain-containing protein
MAKDLVCGMEVSENATGYSSVFEGGKYFFCSPGCLAEFKRRPQDYLKPAADCCGKSPCCCGKPSGGESLEEVKRDV